MFITFEGIDFSGKTTQSKMLYNYLISILGEEKVIWTREPGGTESGQKIRELIKSNNVCQKAELFLFMADRQQHLQEKILPALNESKIVICDRYIDSTIAYQGGGREYGYEYIVKLLDLIGFKEPDLTFYINIPIETMQLRMKKNIRGEELTKFEKEDIDFFKRITDIFKMREEDMNRKYIIIDINGENNIDDIHEKIKSKVEYWGHTIKNIKFKR